MTHDPTKQPEETKPMANLPDAQTSEAPRTPTCDRRIDSKGVLFPLGRVVATRGALEYLERMAVAPGELLAKHRAGDWGDIGAEDRAENWLSIERGFRVMSCYRHGPAHEAIWIITEADRGVTTLLLPAEY